MFPLFFCVCVWNIAIHSGVWVVYLGKLPPYQLEKTQKKHGFIFVCIAKYLLRNKVDICSWKFIKFIQIQVSYLLGIYDYGCLRSMIRHDSVLPGRMMGWCPCFDFQIAHCCALTSNNQPIISVLPLQPIVALRLRSAADHGHQAVLELLLQARRVAEDVCFE